ncbi:MAG: FAD binding domain-containing protein [Candidatus Cyclobacteriaceae bacterium M3_2C_046]
MNKFSWYQAKSIEDALDKVNTTASDLFNPLPGSTSVIYKAGGVDLLDLMKEGLVNPSGLVDVKKIPGLDKIEYDETAGLKIGANVTLSDIEYHPLIKEKYLALYQAVAHAGTPQLRNLATLGGNLAQRTRCWYFRSIDHKCFRKGTRTCFAQDGENEFHAIIDNEYCASVHASSVATALMAFNTKVYITRPHEGIQEFSLESFFVHPEQYRKNETILKNGDLITGILIPVPEKGTKSYYIKQGARESHDWAIADVAVVAQSSGGKCKSAEIVLGAAAPVPIKSNEAAKEVVGNKINESVAIAAGKASMKEATPLAGNKYKIPIFETIVKRALLNCV